MGFGAIGFAFLAGCVSFLSPCVLPLLPLVLGGAASSCRLGLSSLVAGLVTAFVLVGLFVATIGFAIGIDGDAVRLVSAVLLAGFGLVMLSGVLQRRFATAASGVAGSGGTLACRIDEAARPGQGTARKMAANFALGGAMGAVWSPCVGPTLGAASVLAAQGKDLGQVAAVMGAFAAGAALPLLILGWLGREAMVRWRGRLAAVGGAGRYAVGTGALAVGVLILSGLDRQFETVIVQNSPDWLTDLTTRF